MPKRWIDGSWFISFTGRELRADAPRPEDIDLRDIAHHLALTNRYGGASPTPYSVASHSLMVCDMLEPLGRAAMVEGLLHDAAEAYVGDMIKAIKVRCEDFQGIEAKWDDAIRARFGLPDVCPIKADVKEADIAALLCERRDVFGDTREYDDKPHVAPSLLRHRCIVNEDWRQTKAFFLARAEELGL